MKCQWYPPDYPPCRNRGIYKLLDSVGHFYGYICETHRKPCKETMNDMRLIKIKRRRVK